MKKKILTVILVILILAIAGLYLSEVILQGADPTQNLFRTVAVIAICVINLMRLHTIPQRKPLEFYASQHQDILQDAFADSIWRNKLLCAVRLYNEGNLRKAVKYLLDLQSRCQSKADYYAVYLLLGLCFTDMKLYKEAAHAYRELVNSNLADSRIYSNLGYVHHKAKDDEQAMTCYRLALRYDSRSEHTHCNIAQIYFDQYKLDEAQEWYHKALALNPSMYQAAGMLAVIYTLEKNQEEADKYFHIAVSNGQDAADLRRAIEWYCKKPDPAEEMK